MNRAARDLVVGFLATLDVIVQRRAGAIVTEVAARLLSQSDAVPRKRRSTRARPQPDRPTRGPRPRGPASRRPPVAGAVDGTSTIGDDRQLAGLEQGRAPAITVSPADEVTLSAGEAPVIPPEPLPAPVLPQAARRRRRNMLAAAAFRAAMISPRSDTEKPISVQSPPASSQSRPAAPTAAKGRAVNWSELDEFFDDAPGDISSRSPASNEVEKQEADEPDAGAI